MNKATEVFSSRFGLIAATLGMAIGAGNIWRFPRVAGQYGGSFLLPWIIFLFSWSIPLLIVEFAIGKKIKKGPIGAFSQALGPAFTWMGWFVGFCTTAILFYYSVVCGWGLKYFLLSVTSQINSLDHITYWDSYSQSYYQPVMLHLVSLGIGCFIIFRGIVKGIEKFSKFIIPFLYLLLLIAAIQAIRLPGAETGISYFLTIDPSMLTNYKLWLEALSQSAWSTGAGWGLLLTYAVYSRKKEKVTQNAFFAGIGNNFASILTGLAVIPTIFALSTSAASAQEALASGNQGLAFIVMPQLFTQVGSGTVFSTIFFLSLFIAALSSLISMIELAVRMFADFGMTRNKALTIVFIITALIGTPSAISPDIFNNQDWVWGLGLLLSGLFFCISVIKIGATRFIEDWLQPVRGQKVYIVLFKILFYFIIPLEFLFMLVWWFAQSVQWNPGTWWNPLEIFSLGSCLVQWGIVIAAGIYFGPRWSRLLN